MDTAWVLRDLSKYGPQAGDMRVPALGEAQAYCQKLASTHYENFTVASGLLPSALRQHFANVYAYCRWADDLADELSAPEQSGQLLDWWQTELERCYGGQVRHPVFVALAETIREFAIPEAPFLDLLTAFRRDQEPRGYATFAELLAYCQHSANPVGQLVLYLGRCRNETTTALSNSICTGLQLANFWQDVARDFARGRVYLPEETCRRFGYGAANFARREENESFREMVAFEVNRAEEYLHSGWPLVNLVSAELRFEVELFIRGGLATIAAIRALNYNVWSRRPRVGRFAKLAILAATWWRQTRGAPPPARARP